MILGRLAGHGNRRAEAHSSSSFRLARTLQGSAAAPFGAFRRLCSRPVAPRRPRTPAASTQPPTTNPSRTEVREGLSGGGGSRTGNRPPLSPCTATSYVRCVPRVCHLSIPAGGCVPTTHGSGSYPDMRASGESGAVNSITTDVADLARVGVSEADTRLSAQVVPATDRRLPQEQVKAEPG